MAEAMITSGSAVVGMSDCDPYGDADAGELVTARDFVCGTGGMAVVLPLQVQGNVQAPRETLGHW